MALSASQPTEYISPIPQEERITILDILRGYALFGVLLINLRNFDLPGQLWTDSANQVALWLTIWLADTKFVTVFSFLFGVGFSLQIQRAESKGARSVPLYLRRLLVLACFGFLHYLIYDGDILFPYAVAGLGLLLLRGLSQRKILWIAAVCFLVPIVGYAFQTAGQEDIQIDRVLNLRLEGALRNETEFRRIYLEGSLLDVAAAHAKDFADWYTQWEPYLWNPRGGVGGIFMFPLPLFLLGYYVGRRGVFQNLRPHLSWIRKFSIWGLLLGLFLTAVSLASEWGSLSPYPPRERHWAGILFFLGTPLLAYSYAAALVVLAQRPRWRDRLMPLGSVGRMALTNYLMQSIIFTTLIYGYGFALYGQIGPLVGIGLTIIMYCLQVVLSSWWLKRFRFGPAEWLWRTLTYGRLQPMRVDQVR